MIYIEETYYGPGNLGYIGEQNSTGKFLCAASPSGFITTSAPATLPMFSGTTPYLWHASIDDSLLTANDLLDTYSYYIIDLSKNTTVDIIPVSYPMTGSGIITVYVPSGVTIISSGIQIVPSGIQIVPSGYPVIVPSGYPVYVPSGVPSGILVVPSGYAVPSGIEYIIINEGGIVDNSDYTGHDYQVSPQESHGVALVGGISRVRYNYKRPY